MKLNRCSICNHLFKANIPEQNVCGTCGVYERITEHASRLWDKSMDLKRKRREVKDVYV